MNRLKRAAILGSLVERLGAVGSWCGETHVQKATYFLQELLLVPLGFKFVLYKYGPFSFDLQDELTALRADELLDVKPQGQPFGPKLTPGRHAENLKLGYPETLQEYDGKLTFLISRIGEKSVTQLERLATAFYVTQDEGTPKDEQPRAVKLHELKPHISIDQALGAIYEVDSFIAAAKALENQ